MRASPARGKMPVSRENSSGRGIEMKPNDLRDKLKGVIAFPITPFRADNTIDVEGLHKNLQPILRTPVAAIVAAAGTGELYSLTPAEHETVVKTVVQEVAGKVPVIAGAG